MASSQEPGPIQRQRQLQGDISNRLREDLEYDDRHHWDDKRTHFIICPEQVEGGAQNVEFHETGSEPFKAALVYKVEGRPQYWMFAWKSPPPESGPTNKVLTRLYRNKQEIIWPLIEAELELSTNKSSYIQDGAKVHFTAPEYGTSDFKAKIEYAPK